MTPRSRRRRRRDWRRRARVLGVLAALGVLLWPPGLAREVLPGPVPARVVRVLDGDTFEVRARIWLGQDMTVRVRLADVDAPALNGKCAHERTLAVAARDLATDLPRMGELVIYDLEFTAWPGSRERGWSGPGEHREVIQIGAVRLAASDLRERDAFERLVRPRVNPTLSIYIVELTGITDGDLATRGETVVDAVAAFAAFARGAAFVGSNGDAAAVLRETLALNGLAAATLPAGLADVAPMVARHIAASSNCDLPGLFGQPMPGRPHDALSDARAVALALRELRRQGKV